MTYSAEEAEPTVLVPDRSALSGEPETLSDSDDFDMILGIPLDASFLSEDAVLSVVEDEIADVTWYRENINGDLKQITLRATKNPELAHTMHGISQSSLTEGLITNVSVPGGEDVELTYFKSVRDNLDLYIFAGEDTHYTLTLGRGFSKMTVAAILDSVMLATGLMKNPVRVLPRPVLFSLSALPDGQYRVGFSPEDFRQNGETWELSAEIFVPEEFDLVDITMLSEGDILIAGGEEIPVTEVAIRTDDSGLNFVALNGGLDRGGLDLRQSPSGTLLVEGYDDAATYQNMGAVLLPVSESAVLTDASDLSRKTPAEARGPKKIASYLVKPELPPITPRSAAITVTEGQVTTISITYVP